MKSLSTFFILAVALISACAQHRTATSDPAVSTPSPTNAAPANLAANVSSKFAKPVASATASECEAVDAGNKKVLRNQTFAIDFEPYRGGCFVTSSNREYEGSPMESEYAIYVDGKKVFDFPDQFNQTAFGCWVDAVAFQDLDDDGLTDIIMIGKCSGKSQTYNENMVYANNGSEFTTDTDANYKLSEFSKVKDVANFVKKHRKTFFH